MAWEFTFLDMLQGLHTPPADLFFSTITHLGDGGLFWIALGLILLCFKKTRRWGVCVLTGLLFGALITNVALKPLVARERPCWINDTVQLLIANPTDFSFPSGHSQASFVSATAIFMNDRKWGTAAYVLAALIAFSRLYLYVHFPTDVLVGAVIGIAAGILTERAIRKWMPKGGAAA
ncbi:MAG: phosphatase PAP2 family protein [Eubacteriales bacterium]|nr:phosphatase PAP2 family protein [Eubacteriales bacterium]